MLSPRFHLAAALSLLAAIALAGCGIQEAGLRAQRRKQNFDDLKALGLAFHNASDRNQRAPSRGKNSRRWVSNRASATVCRRKELPSC